MISAVAYFRPSPHQDLADVGTRDLQHALNLLRSNVLAARGLDQVLLPVSDPQITLLVQLTDVAGPRTSRR